MVTGTREALHTKGLVADCTRVSNPADTELELTYNRANIARWLELRLMIMTINLRHRRGWMDG